MLPKFYIINHPNHPWGDYGNTLSQGMAHRNKDGILEVRRTGPFVPPITLPGIGEVVAADKMRQALSQSGLKGVNFEPVIKRLIVHSDWHTWDQSADEPPEFPEGGEPEGYILDQPHSFLADKQMGNLWALQLNRDAQTQREQRIVEHRRQIQLVIATWGGQDIFNAQDVGFTYVTEQAKAWLERHATGHLTFEEAEVTAVPKRIPAVDAKTRARYAHDKTLLFVCDVLARLASPVDDQIREKEPNACVACNLVNEYGDASATRVATGFSGDLERAWKALGETLKALQKPDLGCNDDEVIRRPAWQAVREAAADALMLFQRQDWKVERSKG